MNQSLDAARNNWRAHFENRNIIDVRASRAIANLDDFLSRQSKEDADRVKAEITGVYHTVELTVRASAMPDTTDVFLDEEIGFWGITAKAFQAQLAGVKTKNIVMHINSPGGDVFDGIAIYSALKAHPAHVTAIVDGLAASAASFIALAADKVCMAENAFMMIHKAWGCAVGNQDDMLDMASTLGKLDGQLASIYAGKTGKSAPDCLALMKGTVDGTWFTASEAKDAGLIDAIDPDSDEEPDQEDPDEEKEPEGKKNSISRMRMRLRIAEVA
jgi:ATP-dependent Clp endopeptidase proteolytic subunit ClpP